MSSTDSRSQSSFQCLLTVSSGVDKGKTYPLTRPGSYSIGRAKDSHVLIDESDKRASRSHAAVRIEGGQARIDSLSQTNPTLVNKKAVQSKVLKKGDRILIGATEFMVNLSGAAGPAEKSGSKVKIVCLVVIIAFLLLFIVMRFKKEEPSQPPVSKPVVAEPGLPEEDIISENPDFPAEDIPADFSALDAGEPAADVSPAVEEEADAHFRKAMFFYDARKLGRALDEIDLTLMTNRNHPTARKWLLRITDELNELIDSHYQNGLLNRKFMRYRAAENDFQLVMELSRDQLDERYLDAQKQLEELRELE